MRIPKITRCLLDWTLETIGISFLLMADLGITTAQSIISQLKSKADRSAYTSSTQLLDGLREIFLEILDIPVPDNHRPVQTGPVVLLMVGVNGVGKTTTLAKIANQYKGSGSSVMLAACDTYRAAAIEQLQTLEKLKTKD